MCSSSPTHSGVWGWEESRQRDGENSHGHIQAKAFRPAPQHEGHKRKKGSPLLCVSLSLQKSSSGSGTSQGRCRWADTPELCLQCRCAFARSHTDGSLCVFLCVCDRLCPGGSVSSLQVNHNQSVESGKGVQGDLGEAWPNHCKCHEWDAPDRTACINNSVPSKSKTTKPKIVFGLLHWQSPVTYQNTGLCRATVGRCTWPTMVPAWNLPLLLTGTGKSPAWWRALHWWGTIKKTVVKKRI